MGQNGDNIHIYVENLIFNFQVAKQEMMPPMDARFFVLWKELCLDIKEEYELSLKIKVEWDKHEEDRVS